MGRLSALLLSVLLACGVDVVELAGQDGDVLVLGEVPDDAIARFAREDAKGEPKMLALRYPEEGAALPANIAPVRFDWSSEGKMARAFELRLTSATQVLRVYTSELGVTLPVDRWRALLAEGALRAEVRSLEAGGKGMVRASEPRMFVVSAAVPGTLFLATSDAAARASLADVGTMSTNERERALGAVNASGVVARAMGDRITLDDRGTLVTRSLPAGSHCAHPSWGPDGTLVFTYWPPEVKIDDASDAHEGSLLATLMGDVFSTLPIDERDPRKPRFSPDGASIAFEAGRRDEPSVFIVSASGSAKRSCGAAMPMMPGMMGPPAKGLAASAPAWLTNDWLGFISTRPYLGNGRAQVWLSLASACTPPIWLPAQDAATDYQALAL